MIIVVLIGLGLILGSFVNALTWRLHEQAVLLARKPSKGRSERLRAVSMTHGRSMCPHCQHELAAKDLVPLFSWLWLRGRCHYCGHRIDDNPLVEIALPLLFVISYWSWPLALHGQGLFDFVIWLIFLTAFVCLAVYDLRWFILPDRVVFPLIGLALLQLAVDVLIFGAPLSTLVSAGLGVLCIAGLFYGLFVLSDGRWIGGGDVKLGVVLGVLAGSALNALFLIFAASLAGLVAAIPLLMRGQATRKSHLPFGPFLLLATVITVLVGGRLVAAYTGLFQV